MHRVRAHPGLLALAGIVFGLGLGLAATASATTTPSTNSTSSSNHNQALPPPRGPRGRGPGDGPGRHGRGFGGVLTAVTSSSLTYAGPDGTTHTVGLTSSTTYTRDGATAHHSDLAVGERISVRPVDPSATSPVAASVDIHSPHLGGTVYSVNGNTIVIIDGEGFHRTIHTTSATVYTDNGQSATSSAVTKGQHLNALGSIDTNGTDLDATRVNVGQPPRPTPPGVSGSSSTTSSTTTS